MPRVPLQLVLLLCSASLLASATPAWLQDVLVTDRQPPSSKEQLAQRQIGTDRQSLIHALRSSDPEVRSLAAFVLGEIGLRDGRSDAIPDLAEALRKETVPSTAADIAVVLGTFGDARGARALQTMCQDSKSDSRLKLQVARHLASLRFETCLNPVLDLAFAGDDAVTVGVIDLLPSFQHVSDKDRERMLQVVRRGLFDPSSHMRLVAADVRARMGDRSAAADLQRAINSELDAGVRGGMERALHSLKKQNPE